MSITLRYAARSDVGLVRANNQDSGYAGPDLLAVADGMGGHAGGDIASSIAIASLVHLDGSQHGAEEALDELAAAIDTARRAIIERSAAEPQLSGMGTTVTAILRAGNKLVMAHLGDSRAYLLRDDELSQVTTDHTFVQHLVDTGRITPEDAETHPQRNVVMRVLGDFEVDLTPDLSVREARPGDRWLLCSDGLSGFVSADTIAQILISVPDPGDCAETLVQLSLRAGSTDNVTCIVADVVDPDEPATAAAAEAAGATDDDDDGDGSTSNADDDSSSEDTAEPASALTEPLGTERAADESVATPTVPGDEPQTAPQVVGSAIEDPVALAAIVAATSGRSSARSAADGTDGTDGSADTEDLGARPSDGPAGQSAADGAGDGEGTESAARTDSDDSDGSASTTDTDTDTSPRRHALRVTGVLVLVLAAFGIGYSAYGWTQDQYYVGASDGQVAVFKGVPQRIGPLTLSTPVELTGTSVAALPPYVQDRLRTTISASSLVDARVRASGLDDQATPTPDATPTGSPTPAPTSTPATPAPTTSPRTTPTKSAHAPATKPGHGATHGPATKSQTKGHSK
jgi:protein phosphatase